MIEIIQALRQAFEQRNAASPTRVSVDRRSYNVLNDECNQVLIERDGGTVKLTKIYDMDIGVVDTTDNRCVLIGIE